MKATITSILILGLALPAGAVSRTSARPQAGPTVTDGAASGLWVAKRRKRRRGKRAPKAPPPPVKVTTPGVSEVTLRQGRKAQAVVTLKPQEKLDISFSGAGKLAIVLFNALPKKSSERTSAIVTVSVDGGPIKRVTLPTRLNRKGNLKADIGPLVSKPKKHFTKLRAGDHTADLEVISGALGVAVRVEWYPLGHRKPAPLVFEPAGDMVATVPDLDEDEGVTPPPAPDLPPAADMAPIASSAPPVAPDAPPPPTEPVTPAEETAAAPVVTEPPPPTPAPASTSPAAELEKKIASGEIRHGLIGTFDPLELVDTREGDRNTFHRVKEHQSYSILVAGPGELTVRLHRLIDPAKKQEAEGTPYSIVILENDVVLQQLSGTTEASQNWQIDPAFNADGLLLSEPKEYHLKVSANQSRLALQISEAPLGMAIRYDYAAETMSLAAMDLGFDDEDDDLGPIGPATSKPTVVMEVAVTEKVIIEERPGFIGLAVQAGTVIPAAGGDPVIAGGTDVRFALPFVQGLTVGAHAAYHRHTMQTNVGDLDGVAVRPRSSTHTVPLFVKATYSMPLGRVLGIYADFGAGVSYVRASTRARGAETVATGWLFGGMAGGGIEFNTGIGWLGVDGSYLFTLPGDFEGTLQDYTPGGPGVALQYRIGI
jgi:hypothetical protein